MLVGLKNIMNSKSLKKSQIKLIRLEKIGANGKFYAAKLKLL